MAAKILSIIKTAAAQGLFNTNDDPIVTAIPAPKKVPRTHAAAAAAPLATPDDDMPPLPRVTKPTLPLPVSRQPKVEMAVASATNSASVSVVEGGQHEYTYICASAYIYARIPQVHAM